MILDRKLISKTLVFTQISPVTLYVFLAEESKKRELTLTEKNLLHELQ